VIGCERDIQSALERIENHFEVWFEIWVLLGDFLSRVGQSRWGGNFKVKIWVIGYRTY